MKLLFDENLSSTLVSLLKEIFPGSIHVSDVDLEAALDVEIWDFARRNGFALVSKDSDLSEIGMIRGFPPPVVWIRRGNCSTMEIAALMRANVVAIREIEHSPDRGVIVLE